MEDTLFKEKGLVNFYRLIENPPITKADLIYFPAKSAIHASRSCQISSNDRLTC